MDGKMLLLRAFGVDTDEEFGSLEGTFIVSGIARGRFISPHPGFETRATLYNPSGHA